MKNNLIWSILFVFVLTAGFAACGDSGSNNTKHAQEEADETAEVMQEEKEDVTEQMREMQTALNQRIGNLEAQMEDASEEGKAALQAQADKLKDLSEKIKAQAEEIGGTAQTNWENFKSDMSRTMEDVKNALSDNDANE